MPARKKITFRKNQVIRLRESGIKSVRRIAANLGCATEAGKLRVREILESNGYRCRHWKWSKEEITTIRRRYSNILTAIIARELNRPVSSVYNKAHTLGLHKSAEWLKDDLQKLGRKLAILGRATRFKEGHVTWNAGVRGLKFPGSEKGQFKKGQRSKRWHGYRNGTIRIREDKTGRFYKSIRLAPGKWVHLHRYMWEKARGPIPKGKLIVFKNRDSTDCRLRNLLLIDRKTHGARWSATDGGIAKAMACVPGGKGKINQRLFNELMKHPEVLQQKRAQMELQRMIRKAAAR
jgi:hypothetical protein